MTDGVPDKPIKDENSETSHYKLPLRRLLEEINYMISNNRRQIEGLEEMLADPKIIARQKQMQDELIICQHHAVQGAVELTRERLTVIMDRYQDLILF